MPGGKNVFNQLLRAYKKNKISSIEINRAATNVLKSIMKTNIYKKYKK